MKRILTAALAVATLGGAAALVSATPAAAQHRDWHGDRGWHHGYRGYRGGTTVVIGAPYPYGYGYGGCYWRTRWSPYYGRYVRARVCY